MGNKCKLILTASSLLVSTNTTGIALILMLAAKEVTILVVVEISLMITLLFIRTTLVSIFATTGSECSTNNSNIIIINGSHSSSYTSTILNVDWVWNGVHPAF